MTLNLNVVDREKRMRSLPSFAIALLSAMFYCFYVPEITYLSNINEFSFNGIDLLIAMLPWFAVIFVCFLSVLLLAEKALPVVGASWGKWRVSLSPIHVFLVAVMIAFWIEGSILSRGLPALSGDADAYLSKGRFNSSFATWAIVLPVAMFCWRFFAGSKPFALVILPLFLLASIGDAWSGRVAVKAGSKAEVQATLTEVMGNLAFHPRDNTIVIMPDAFATALATKVLDDNPDIGDEMEGFTLFRNNLAAGGQTSWAIPAILQGAVYHGGDFLEFAERATHGKASLARIQSAQGRNVYVSSLLPRYCALLAGDAGMATGASNGMTMDLYQQLGFRFIPYPLKKYFVPPVVAMDLTHRNTPQTKTLAGIDPFYGYGIIPALGNYSRLPTFHFHHYFGVHQPFDTDPRGDRIKGEARYSSSGYVLQGEKVLRDYVAFLRVLKGYGMYDDATLVIMGDHGNYLLPGQGNFSAFELPLFAIKPPRAKGPLRYSDVPFSSIYLSDALEAARKSPSQFVVFLGSLPGERYIFRQPETLIRVAGADLSLAQQENIHLDATLKPTILIPGTRYTCNRNDATLPLAVPQKSQDVSLSGGLGIDILNRYGTLLSFLIQPGTRLIDMKLTVSAYYGGDDPQIQKLLHTVEIVDLNSNMLVLKKEFPAGSGVELLVRDISIDAANAMNLSFRFSPHTLLYLAEVQLENVRQAAVP